MRWPWTRATTGGDRLAIRLTDSELVWAVTAPAGQVLRAGHERRGGDDEAAFLRRIRALGLPTHGVIAVLALDEAQLLQIETPAVKPEEMKNAARWRIKDLVDSRLDELTIDVLHVGDDAARAAHRQLFVVAARNALLQQLSRRAQGAGLPLSVIDTAEMAQRNLQQRAAASVGLGSRTTASLVRHGPQALLTICADAELCYARRLDWDEGALAPVEAAVPALAESLEGLDFVDYGSTDDVHVDVGAPRLVVELQRSFDVWERSWPDHPLAGLWVWADAERHALLEPLARALAFPVHSVEPAALFPGLERIPSELHAAILPLLSALQRHAQT